MRRVHFVPPICATGSDHSNRRHVGTHRADLDGRSVSAQEPAIQKIKCIRLVPGWMIGGGIKGIEAMPFGFNVRSLSHSEPQAPEDSDGLILELSQRMQRSNSNRSCRQRFI